jgi:hypothetical protein
MRCGSLLLTLSAIGLAAECVLADASDDSDDAALERKRSSRLTLVVVVVGFMILMFVSTAVFYHYQAKNHAKERLRQQRSWSFDDDRGVNASGGFTLVKVE